MKTPMSSDIKLTKDEDYESVDSTKYRGMICTTHLGLWYPKRTGIETVVYADSDHVGDYVDQKSTSSICEMNLEDPLKTNQESNTPYQTHIPTPKEIIQSITTTGQTTFPNKILKEELRRDMRSWNEIIQDNAFGTQSDSPFLPASSCHMMYCILTSTPFNFVYFLTKRVEKIKNQPNSPMPYGMILSRLYEPNIKINPHERKSKYKSYWGSMKPWVHPTHLQSIIYISSEEASSDDSSVS
ncbi:hypothetical protein Tco_0568514 [Tanacetum coccineum]